MKYQNNLIANKNKYSEWDEGVFYILAGINVIVPVIFCPFSIPKFAPIKELSLQILVLLGFTMCSLKMISTGRTCWQSNNLDKPVFLYLLFGCISLIWTINIYNSILAIPLFIAGPILFYIITNSVQEQKIIDRLLLLIIFVGMGLGVYGFFQYLGIDFDFWSGNIGRQRVMGLFGNVNYFAEFLILPIALVIGLILSKEKVYNRFFLLISLIIMGTTLFLTFTRGSYLAIAVSIPVILLFYYRSASTEPDKQYYKKIIFYFMLLVIITLAVIYIPHPMNKNNTVLGKLRSRVTIESLTSGSSVLRRMATWKFTWMMIEDRFILGSGIGTYGYHSLKYQADFFAEGNNRDIYPHGYAVQAHNEYLQHWSELGITGLVLFLLIIFTYYRTIMVHFKKMKEKEKAIIIGLAGGVTAVLVDAFFGFPLQLAASISLFWMFIGLTFSQLSISEATGKKTLPNGKDKYISKKEEPGNTLISNKNSNLSKVTFKKALFYFFMIIILVICILLLTRPLMARIYWYNGNQQYKRGNNQDAMNVYKKAIEWNPWNGKIYIDMANSLRLTRNNQGALEYLRRAETLTDHPNLPGNIAYLYIQRGENINAVPYLEKAIKYQRNKENMFPHQLQLAKIYTELEDFQNAEKHFQNALENQTDSVEAYYGLAEVYMNLDKLEQAVDLLQKVIELAPESELAGNAEKMLKKIGIEIKNIR